MRAAGGVGLGDKMDWVTIVGCITAKCAQDAVTVDAICHLLHLSWYRSTASVLRVVFSLGPWRVRCL